VLPEVVQQSPTAERLLLQFLTFLFRKVQQAQLVPMALTVQTVLTVLMEQQQQSPLER
jgi:hypothetical protein